MESNWKFLKRGGGLSAPVRRIMVRSLTLFWFDPDRFKVTESLFLDDDVHTAAFIAELTAVGVRFALDDFGTGYSSLARLYRQAPILENQGRSQLRFRFGRKSHKQGNCSRRCQNGKAAGHGDRRGGFGNGRSGRRHARERMHPGTGLLLQSRRTRLPKIEHQITILQMRTNRRNSFRNPLFAG